MTVTIGIYCNDGIVIASDSALTINGQIEQPYNKKVACLEPNLIVGFAGDLGFAQRFRQVLKDVWNPQSIPALEQGEAHKVISAFCTGGLTEYLSTHQNNFPVNVQTAFLVGFVHKNKHHLVHLHAGLFQPMVINASMPFVSIGSGYHITNPFLSFIKKVFWHEQEVPTLQVGIFSAILAINLAIEINCGGINAPLHLAVLKYDEETGYSCSKLQDDEISQHQENAKEAIKYFSQYKHIFSDNVGNAPAIPQPPQNLTAPNPITKEAVEA